MFYADLFAVGIVCLALYGGVFYFFTLHLSEPVSLCII